MKIAYILTFCPWPPDTGTKIRCFQILKHLSARHQFHVVIISNSLSVPPPPPGLNGQPASVTLFNPATGAVSPVSNFAARMKSLITFHPYTQDPDLTRRISAFLLEKKPGAVLVAGSRAAHYLDLKHKLPGVPYMIEEGCMDHMRFAFALPLARNPMERMRTMFNMARTRRFERWMCARMDKIFAPTAAERDCIEQLCNTDVELLPAGANIELFQYHYAGDDNQTLLFCGDMSYSPNADAAIFLLKDILPGVIARFPDIKCYIVGRGASSDIQSQARRFNQVVLTGYVEDVRPYFRESSIFVSPMRYGRGYISKIMDAFAAGPAVVATRFLIGSLDVTEGKELLIADDAHGMVEKIDMLIQSPGRKKALSMEGRAYAEKRTWEKALKPLSDYIEALEAGTK